MIQENQLYVLQSQLQGRVLAVVPSADTPNRPKLVERTEEESQKFIFEKEKDQYVLTVAREDSTVLQVDEETGEVVENDYEQKACNKWQAVVREEGQPWVALVSCKTKDVLTVVSSQHEGERIIVAEDKNKEGQSWKIVPVE